MWQLNHRVMVLGVFLFLSVSPACAMRIGVTGAHGFLGNEVAWQAAVQGHQVALLISCQDKNAHARNSSSVSSS